MNGKSKRLKKFFWNFLFGVGIGLLISKYFFDISFLKIVLFSFAATLGSILGVWCWNRRKFLGTK